MRRVHLALLTLLCFQTAACSTKNTDPPHANLNPGTPWELNWSPKDVRVHFEPGSAALSADSRTEIMTAALSTIKVRWNIIMLRGYGDGYGSESKNRSLAAKRVAAVIGELNRIVLSPSRQPVHLPINSIPYGKGKSLMSDGIEEFGTVEILLANGS